MAEGQLRCVGSSLFLKKTFGVGYNLTIEKRKAREAEESALTTLPEDENRGKVDHSAEDNLCPVLNKDSAHKGPNTSGLDLVKGSDEALISIVKSAVSSAVLLSNVGSELSFQLPVGAAGDFQPMFGTFSTPMVELPSQ